MGIRLSFLPFFDRCAEQSGIQSPLFALGNQEIHESVSDVKAFANERGYKRLALTCSAQALFMDRYGIEQYKDFDLNGRAEVRLDLSKPLPSKYHASAGTVLNAGTLEHIFDQRAAFENVHDMLRVGGTVIHIAPVTWFEHGFVNFNPRVFRMVESVNGYKGLGEDWIGAGNIWEWIHGERGTMPDNMLFLSASQKVKDQPFIAPVEVAP